MSDEGAAAVPLSGGGGLERRVGRVAIRYLYLDGLAYSDLETSDRKAYGKERRPSVGPSLWPGPSAAAAAAAMSESWRWWCTMTRASCEMGCARRSHGRLGRHVTASTTRIATWLILPVVICLSQRLSHACLSTNFYTVKLRMAH